MTETIAVPIARLDHEAAIPTQGNPSDAGYDLCAVDARCDDARDHPLADVASDSRGPDRDAAATAFFWRVNLTLFSLVT